MGESLDDFSCWETGCGRAPRVVVVGLASCFGCQLQMTNAERYLMDVLGQVDLRYWQLASSDAMPDSFDVAVVEGAVTTKEAEETVRRLREQAHALIVVGSCAVTAGIPGLADGDVSLAASQVYARLPAACGDMVAPKPVSAVVDVDFEVRACPIDPIEFVSVLQRVLYGSNRLVRTSTMCGDCRRNETVCFFERRKLCLGLVTEAGCDAKCPALGRPCNGCRGISPDANLASAHTVCRRYGVPAADFDRVLELFNRASALTPAGE